jgi:WD40 repeat protein
MQLRQELQMSIALLALAVSGCSSKSSTDTPSTSRQPAAQSLLAEEKTVAPPPSAESKPTSSPSQKVVASKPIENSEVVAQPPAKKVPKAPPKPSPEQVAKWGLLDYTPLQLLACDDGFADPAVLSMAISPDGKQFVLGGSKLTVWNTGDSQPLVEMLARYDGSEVKRPLRAVAISPDGQWIVGGDQKGMVRVWNLRDQIEVAAIKAHDGRLTGLAFSPDSRVLATTSYSGDVHLWQLPEGKKLKVLKVSKQEITGMVFLSDSLLAAVGSEGAWIWNTENGTKETSLTSKNVIGPAIGLSKDRRWLAFNDPDSVLQVWDVQTSKLSGLTLRGAGAHLIDFSQDGKWIATYSQDSNIRIWDAASGRVAQVIDADGGRTSGLQWLPQTNALLVASESGRVRIWGNSENAQVIGIEPIPLPTLDPPSSEGRTSLTSAQIQRVIDIRSFPRLPGAVQQWCDYGVCAYTAPASQKEAELFYRYTLENSGWSEIAPTVESTSGLVFRKDGCALNLSFTPATAGAGSREGDLQVSLHFAGNYDVRWLPKFSPIDSKSSWDSFSSASYRTKAELTDVEVGLLKQFHEAGWTAYSRLHAMGREESNSRSISMLQRGSVLTVSIGHPADSTEELFVQTSVGVSNKSLPIPHDSGWIEFDSSTELLLVATTKLDLEQAAQFYDTQMAAEGWSARESDRQIKDDKGWLPYIRGQQDVFIRLATLPEGGTRILVGDIDIGNSSWQLKKPNSDDVSEKPAKPGIEAADYKLPKGAAVVKYDVDEKKIEFEVAETTSQKLGERFVEQMESHEWKREGTGIISDDYVFITFSKEKAEIQLRARGGAQKATATISGDGLLWTKPLPTPPVRISYETWLRRDHKVATLDLLDEFAKEMHKIAVGNQ